MSGCKLLPILFWIQGMQTELEEDRESPKKRSNSFIIAQL